MMYDKIGWGHFQRGEHQQIGGENDISQTLKKAWKKCYNESVERRWRIKPKKMIFYDFYFSFKKKVENNA